MIGVTAATREGEQTQRWVSVPLTPTRTPCPDCPAMRSGLFSSFVTTPGGCTFRKKRLEAHEELPYAWLEEHPLALVRRGVLTRGRIDKEGNVLLIDLAPAGTLVSLECKEPTEIRAVTEVLLCALPRREILAHAAETTVVELLAGQRSETERLESFSAVRARHGARARTAALLLVLSPLFRKRTIPEAVHQRVMASLAGLRRETFCRALSAIVRSRAVTADSEGLRVADPFILEGIAAAPRSSSASRD